MTRCGSPCVIVAGRGVWALTSTAVTVTVAATCGAIMTQFSTKEYL